MSIHINTLKRIDAWLEDHAVVRQWLWFAGLWLGGLLAVVIFTYPLKLLIKLAG